MDNENFNKRVAECVGLWLAEGDNKTIREITFTNNCLDLIQFFHKTILNIFKDHTFEVGIYIYSPRVETMTLPFKNCKINRYIDTRATKPYFIWRLFSTEIVKKWKDIVEGVVNDQESYENILRGFFAGEGNIKVGSHNHRSLRIAQGKPSKLVESILDQLNIKYRYSKDERSYTISGKTNWDKCAVFKIADLHPLKKSRFLKIYSEFIEEHYPKNYLKNNLLKVLVNPKTASELSYLFKRSLARMSEVLVELKKLDHVENYKVRSKDYWIRKDQNKIIISSVKLNYLNILKNAKMSTKEISKEFNVCWQSSFRRLKELEKLGLVKIDKNKNWSIQKTKRGIVVI